MDLVINMVSILDGKGGEDTNNYYGRCCLFELIPLHLCVWGHNFLHDLVFHKVELNGAIMICHMGSQQNQITALNW